MKIFITSWKKYPKTWKNKNKPRPGLFLIQGRRPCFFIPGRTRTNQDEPGRTRTNQDEQNNQSNTTTNQNKKTRNQDEQNRPDDIQGIKASSDQAVKASTNPSANKAAQVTNLFKLARRQAHTNNTTTDQATAGVIDPPRFIK